jgi:hypothetical protein
MANELINKIKQWWDVGTINPERDEAKMPVLLLWVERAAIMVVAVVSGIAVAVFGYTKAADYTSLEIVRWLSAGLMFFLATAITDVGVKYFIQKGAFDFFAAFNPKTYKDSKANWQDLVIIVVATILTFVCFHYCELNEFVNDLIKSEWGRTLAKYTIKVLLFCIFISISEVAIKSFFEYNPVGNFSWFQRAMQVVAWACMIAIVAGLFWFDYVSVDSVRRPVANLVKKESKLNQDSIRAVVDAQEQARIGATIAAIQAIETDIRNVQKQIEREKVRVLNSDKAMKKLYDKGHGWARGQVAARQAKAIAPLKDRETQLYSTKQELSNQHAKDLTYRSNIIAKTDSSVLAENAAIDGRNTSLVEGTSSLFIWMGFYAKCIAGLIRILLVVMFMGGNVKDYNGDGKIDHTDVNSAAYVGFHPA